PRDPRGHPVDQRCRGGHGIRAGSDVPGAGADESAICGPPALRDHGGMGMNRRYVPALVAAGAGLGAVGWVLLTGTNAPPIALLMAAASAPLAVLLAVWGRLGVDRFPGRALAGGAVIGPVVALASHAFVFAFAYAFFQ